MDVVKIDKNLKKEIDKYVEEHRLQFPSIKHFMNQAALAYLKKLKGEKP